MSDTVLEQPLVRQYLHELSAACVMLPPALARELRDQIAAHLDEALLPDATNSDVEAELRRLGSPRSLAAAAAGPGRQAGWRRLGNWLGHVRWWVWLAVVLVVAMAGTGTGVLVSMRTAAPLTLGGGFGWYFPEDQAHEVDTQAGDTTQLTIAQRYRQEQGFITNVYNDSDWTQTVLGVSPYYWVPFSNMPAQVAVGSDKNADLGGFDPQVHWSLPSSIPPHSVREFRVLWDSNVCWVPGSGPQFIQDVKLIVRVGTVTRTEDIPLLDAVAVSGNKGAQCK